MSSEANEKLILAVPKGRILKEAAPLFARAGIQPEAAFADPDARQLRFAPGTILVLDRGYVDYGWFGRLTTDAVALNPAATPTVTLRR